MCIFGKGIPVGIKSISNNFQWQCAILCTSGLRTEEKSEVGAQKLRGVFSIIPLMLAIIC